MTGAVDVALVKKKSDDDPMLVLERLASDPNVSAEKIERLVALVERAQAKRAETAFNAAMSSAQKEMRRVAADAENPQTRSKYASYAALDRALRPIYTEHDFGLSFDTGETVREQEVRVLCYVTHAGGHSRTYHIDMPSDGKGARGGDVMTRTHATGSAASYGMRYLLKMIFNVAIGEDDDDGNRASAPRQERQDVQTEAPAGFDQFLIDMEIKADEGWPALSQEFNRASQPFRERLTKLPAWDAMKKKAQGKVAK
jgi:hypothetical protein